jgi:hypothetical protein
MADDLAPRPPLTSVMQTSALDPEARADPHGRLADLRETCPHFRDEIAKTWFFTRHADVRAVVNDRSLARHPSNVEDGSHTKLLAVRTQGMPKSFEEAGTILFMDDPDHQRVREPLAKAFYARVAAMKQRIEAVVESVLAGVTSDRFDLVADVAIPIPILAIARILGVEEHRLAEFREWSEGAILGLYPMKSAEQTAQMVAAAGALDDYFLGLMAARRSAPEDDLISDMVRLQAEGAPLSDAEISVNLAALLIGGNLTTTDLISMAVRLLLTNPDQLAAFKADPGLASAVVEETLRYDPPIDITGRVVMEDRDLAGCPVKARQHVMTSLRAANRDPAVFPNPDVFDPARPHTAPHVAFGGGSHICIGAPLARIEAAAALKGIFARWPNLRLAHEDFEWRTLPFFRGLARLDVIA